jgi:hypothetical protein
MGNKGGKDKGLKDSGKKKSEPTQTATKAEKIDINGKGLEKLSDTYVMSRIFHC